MGKSLKTRFFRFFTQFFVCLIRIVPKQIWTGNVSASNNLDLSNEGQEKFRQGPEGTDAMGDSRQEPSD